ncbi:MAG: NADH oxidoreductase (quinone) subunit F [Chloroflexi bacterium]|nr:NADH oxidoreductase (quinone) subunit F [Chloroflexota bacterium]MDL1882452.1 NADH-quinone oxidoreductase subunit NuoF [Anaerolineae bacterium CFX8]GIL11708.1 MAG: NADH-quinone oxidoreductase subunit F [Chloroflexota bacterium]
MTHILLRGRDIPDIWKFDVYVKNGGYEAFKKALGMEPKAVIDEVKASNLRGRGGAGFPTGLKWSFIPQSEPVKYVAVNADESETGTFKDREIMETNPHQLIEGALICAWAIQAKAVYIYLRGEFWDLAHELDKRIEEARQAGFIGQDIQGTGWSCEVYTHLGAGAYICGEESALLNSLEGKLGQPRVRPPFPAQKGGGLYGEPTVVNNVETLTNVPWIIANGADAYKKIGTEQSAGPKIFCVSGHVVKPGNYELPLGITLRELLYDHAGGVPDGKAMKAILPSGGSGPIIPATNAVLDTPLTYEDLGKIGSILGSASIIVMDETVDITWVAAKVTKFFKHESCGKCTPCREGTYWLDKVLDRIMAGQARLSDIELIDNIAKNMQGVTLCALGDFAANPIIYTIKNFRDDFMQHVQKAEAKPAPKTRQAAPAGD